MAHDRNPPPWQRYGAAVDTAWMLRAEREGLAAWKLLLCLLVPWALFCLIAGLLSAPVHGESPRLVYTAVVSSFVMVLVTGATAEDWQPSRKSLPGTQKAWLTLLSMTLFVAWLAAVFLGSANYKYWVEPYCRMRSLAIYSQVDPTRVAGRELQNAGVVEFVEGAVLDTSRSACYEHQGSYCVTPITLGGSAGPAALDFWAVGTDWCAAGKNASSSAGLRCRAPRDLFARGGVRHMLGDDHALYVQAVRKAERLHGVESRSPVLLHWTGRGASEVQHWRTTAISIVVLGAGAHFLFQSVVVSVAGALAAPKDGELPT
mmetsp:Transcript_5145/g.14512  ORF Transcript_5145/g.14512 Transcript_5145/m.14512 type:complete len:317 (+) Transcript_5145:117-1067(+)